MLGVLLAITARKVDFLHVVLEELEQTLPGLTDSERQELERCLAGVVGDLDPELFLSISEEVHRSIDRRVALEELDRPRIWKAFARQGSEQVPQLREWFANR